MTRSKVRVAGPVRLAAMAPTVLVGHARGDDLPLLARASTTLLATTADKLLSGMLVCAVVWLLFSMCLGVADAIAGELESARARRRARAPAPVRLRLASGATVAATGVRCELARGRVSFKSGARGVGRRRAVALGKLVAVEPPADPLWTPALARRRAAAALAAPLAPAPAASHVPVLVGRSLATRVGSLTAPSLDVEAEAERALGLPVARQRLLERSVDELALTAKLAAALGVALVRPPGTSLAVVCDPRDAAEHEPGALAPLARPLAEAGISAVVVLARDPGAAFLEQLVPPGWLGVLAPARGRHARCVPGWTPARRGADTLAWIAPDGDRLLVPALGRDLKRRDVPAAAERLGDALDAAKPALTGLRSERACPAEGAWRAAIAACAAELRWATSLTRDFDANERDARAALAAAVARVAGGRRGPAAWEQVRAARRTARAITRERRRAAAARLDQLARAEREIATLPGTRSVRRPPGLGALELEFDAPGAPAGRWRVLMPLDATEEPRLSAPRHQREQPAASTPIALDGTTAAYAEALEARRYADAVRILLGALDRERPTGLARADDEPYRTNAPVATILAARA